MRKLDFAMMLSTLALAGCGGAPAPPARPVAAPLTPPRLVDAVAGEGSAAIAPVCAAGAAELDDALDNDCDASIDEGHGAATDGALVIAAAWSEDADLELEIEGPAGAPAERVSSRGACAGEPARERAAYAEVEPGDWQVYLRHADPCGTSEPVTASLSAVVDGEGVGPLNRSIAPGERALIVTLRLAR